MLHGQLGYRSLEKTKRAYSEIYLRLVSAGYGIDRYGVCLDWSMGYPASMRSEMPRGTGLILAGPEDFSDLCDCAPVAPHFGDFVLGTPAALENTAAALEAGSTSIGNIGQYFTFKLPHWDDDAATTAQTVKAIALCAAQPEDILIHSNLDDGFAALFCDLACGIGAVLIERRIVDGLLGGRVSHCYGHTFSEPLNRLAFHMALSEVTDTPGSMVYGNTTIYVENEIENYANLGSYFLVDILSQSLFPMGHGLNPVPVTEAVRIPEVDEIVDAHLFANRLIARAEGFKDLIRIDKARNIADRLVEGGRLFKDRVLEGLDSAGIDVNDPFEMLLSIRRIGARRLEEMFGPGEFDKTKVHHRRPLVTASTVAALEAKGDELIRFLDPPKRESLSRSNLVVCVACTDVHEYGKILLEAVLNKLNVGVVDAGVSADPDVVAKRAQENRADFIALSTYNGVALSYIRSLRNEMDTFGTDIPVFIGGKLNQIPEDSPDSMPVDVTSLLEESGAVVCRRVEDMINALVIAAQDRKA